MSIKYDRILGTEVARVFGKDSLEITAFFSIIFLSFFTRLQEVVIIKIQKVVIAWTFSSKSRVRMTFLYTSYVIKSLQFGYFTASDSKK